MRTCPSPPLWFRVVVRQYMRERERGLLVPVCSCQRLLAYVTCLCGAHPSVVDVLFFVCPVAGFAVTMFSPDGRLLNIKYDPRFPLEGLAVEEASAWS